MNQAAFPSSPGSVSTHAFVGARMIITTYDQGVRFLSSEPFGGLRLHQVNRLGSPLPFVGEFELALMVEVVDRREAWVGLSF